MIMEVTNLYEEVEVKKNNKTIGQIKRAGGQECGWCKVLQL